MGATWSRRAPRARGAHHPGTTKHALYAAAILSVNYNGNTPVAVRSRACDYRLPQSEQTGNRKPEYWSAESQSPFGDPEGTAAGSRPPRLRALKALPERAAHRRAAAQAEDRRVPHARNQP